MPQYPGSNAASVACRMTDDMRRVLLAALFWLLSLHAQAQGVPRLACDEPVHRFGTVEPPEPVRHVFVIRNEGTAPLRIEGVRTSCGCVVGRIGNATLEPGGELDIRTELPTLGRLGAQRSTILVVSNDPLRRHFPLVLEGTIARVVRIEPEMLLFGTVAPGSPAVKRELLVHNDGPEPLDITEIAVSPQYYRAVLETVVEGRRWRVKVTFDPPATPGICNGGLRLLFNGETGREVAVPLSALAAGALLAAPAEVLLDPGDSPVSRHVIVRSRDNEPFEITRVEHDGELVRHQVQPFGPARYRVRLDGLSARMAAGPPIHIHTSLDEMPVIKVPVRLTGTRAATGEAP